MRHSLTSIPTKYCELYYPVMQCSFSTLRTFYRLRIKPPVFTEGGTPQQFYCITRWRYKNVGAP